MWSDYILNPYKDDYDVVKPWHYLLDRLKRKMRILRGFEDLYDAPTPGEDYAFSPLQLEPEMSHTLFAPFYNDQLWVIKQTARSLPMRFKLYVKEHPAMFGFRTRKFYQQLKKIPNVKLINPETPSFGITNNARLIIAITSTTAWEGELLKKPVITFGNVFFNILPMVKKCTAIEDLPYLIKNQLGNFQYNEEALLHLIAAIHKESVNLDLAQMWDVEGGGQMEKHEKELSLFVDLIASKLDLKPIPNRVTNPSS